MIEQAVPVVLKECFHNVMRPILRFAQMPPTGAQLKFSPEKARSILPHEGSSCRAATTRPRISGRLEMGGTGYQPVRRGNLPRRMGRRLELSASSLSVEPSPVPPRITVVALRQLRPRISGRSGWDGRCAESHSRIRCAAGRGATCRSATSSTLRTQPVVGLGDNPDLCGE